MAQRDLPLHSAASIVGNSPAISALRDQIHHLASFDTIGNPHIPSLLLYGETGTGKGLVARVLHDSGPRAHKPFININCAAIPETLIEAELFGFEAGAFTDAKRAKPGLFEAASAGTLFLDEIEALPMPLQGKFLKAVEEKLVRRLGAVAEHQVDVKLIAATQQDLNRLVTEGRFRADLYHRLAVVVMEVPPLRERGEDIVLLAQHFLRQYADAHGLVLRQLSKDAEAWLVGYGWPGNVRELGHLMEWVTLLGQESVVDAHTLEQMCLVQLPTAPVEQPPQGDSEPLDEPARIREVLIRTGGNVGRAARLLGLTRNALRYRIRRYGVERPSWEDQGTAGVTPLSISEEKESTRLHETGGGGSPGVGPQVRPPAGEQKPVAAFHGKARSARRRRIPVIAAVVDVIVALAGGLARWQPWAPQFEPASVEKMAYPLPEKPSIAVLPFANMSPEPRDAYIADGLTENIITALSHVPRMFVIARSSTSRYKGKTVKVQQVAKELGVRYVLDGSVQKAGERLRISAQLIDAKTGNHLWAERYDRVFKDLFALQDEITLKIVVALSVELTEGEEARVRHRSTNDLEAWSYAVKTLGAVGPQKKQNIKVRVFLQRAVEIDPGYAWAWSRLVLIHYWDARFGFSASREESWKRGVELAQKAIALDEKLPEGHLTLALLHLYRKQYDQAIAEAEKAVALGPNNSDNLARAAQVMHYSGRFEEALALIKNAMRSNPYYGTDHLRFLGGALRFTGQHEEAIVAFTQLLERRKGTYGAFLPNLYLASIYGELGRLEEARAHVRAALEIKPDASIAWMQKILKVFRDPAHAERVLAGLRKAGLP